MGHFFRFLLRLFAVTLGFIAACVIAACMEVVLNAMALPDGLQHLQARGVDFRLMIGLAGLAGLIGHAAFLPSIVLIFIGELVRLRNWFAYMLGGAIIAGIVVGLADRAGVALAMDPRHLAVDIVSGMLGGFGYWIIAGHNAGRWLPSQKAHPANHPTSAE